MRLRAGKRQGAGSTPGAIAAALAELELSGLAAEGDGTYRVLA